MAGSWPIQSTSVFEEGLMCPPVRFYDQGRVNEEVYKILLRNSRFPEDLRDAGIRLTSEPNSSPDFNNNGVNSYNINLTEAEMAIVKKMERHVADALILNTEKFPSEITNIVSTDGNQTAYV